MKYLRIITCLLASLIGLFLTIRQITNALSQESVIVIDGLLNIWGSYGMFIGFSYFVLYHIKHPFIPSLRIGNVEKVALVIAIIITPLLAMGTYSQAKANVANYVECKSERKLSSRYSSRTYARTEELCLSLTPHQGEPTSSPSIP